MRRGLTTIVLCLAGTAAAWPAAAAIYACTDASGRRITSDRPIAECMDREQREFDTSGIPRRTLGPSMSEMDRAALDEKARKQALEQQRANEERLRLRALLARYPSASQLERDRLSALAPVNETLRSAQDRLATLDAERQRLTAGTLLPASAVAAQARARDLEQNEAERSAQRRYIAEKLAEKTRIHQRFDAMQQQLQPLWSAPAAVPAIEPMTR